MEEVAPTNPTPVLGVRTSGRREHGNTAELAAFLASVSGLPDETRRLIANVARDQGLVELAFTIEGKKFEPTLTNRIGAVLSKRVTRKDVLVAAGAVVGAVAIYELVALLGRKFDWYHIPAFFGGSQEKVENNVRRLRRVA